MALGTAPRGHGANRRAVRTTQQAGPHQAGPRTDKIRQVHVIRNPVVRYPVGFSVARLAFECCESWVRGRWLRAHGRLRVPCAERGLAEVAPVVTQRARLGAVGVHPCAERRAGDAVAVESIRVALGVRRSVLRRTLTDRIAPTAAELVARGGQARAVRLALVDSAFDTERCALPIRRARHAARSASMRSASDSTARQHML